MYQTARSQRAHWSESRKKLQKERRAENLKQVVKQDGSSKGYQKIINLHKRFLVISELMRIPEPLNT